MAGLCSPLPTLRRCHRGHPRTARADVDRYAFTARDLHPLLLTVSPTHSVSPSMDWDSAGCPVGIALAAAPQRYLRQAVKREQTEGKYDDHTHDAVILTAMAIPGPVMGDVQTEQVKAGCMSDYSRFCFGTLPGSGHILTCLGSIRPTWRHCARGRLGARQRSEAVPGSAEGQLSPSCTRPLAAAH
jgi:hypothetical protein